MKCWIFFSSTHFKYIIYKSMGNGRIDSDLTLNIAVQFPVVNRNGYLLFIVGNCHVT